MLLIIFNNAGVAIVPFVPSPQPIGLPERSDISILVAQMSPLSVRFGGFGSPVSPISVANPVIAAPVAQALAARVSPLGRVVSDGTAHQSVPAAQVPSTRRN